MPEKPGKAAEEPRAVITEEEWAKPVTFDEAGTFVSLREYEKGGRVFIPPASLTDDQWLALAVKRIEMNPGYDVTSLSSGRVTWQRALDEVRAKTKLGLRLAETEKRVIIYLIGEVTKPRS